MKKILIATTNDGKFNEITAEFADLPFKFVNLKQVKLNKFDIDEKYATTWENALEKAKFYAKKSQLLTIAEDTGFFVDHLKGEPGVKAKRYAATALERNNKIIQQLCGIKGKKRSARFETSACVYNPVGDNFCIYFGRVIGKIAEKVTGQWREGLGYDSIFYYEPLKKCFSELSIAEKNLVSHRGHIIAQLKTHLTRHFGFKQFIAPVAVIIKDRKMLLTLRRDNRPQFNNKWEFPGGGVEKGEEIIECLKRETNEETGYDVEVLERLPDIFSANRDENNGNYQVFLILHICKIKSGEFKAADAETSGCGWFTYKEAVKARLLPLNKKSIQSINNKKILLKYID